MSFSLSSNFLTNARGVTFADGGGITWSFNKNTNQITANGSSAGAGAADPTAKVGLTTVNGEQSTWMRSDASPPIDQAISPTWTGNHAFTAGSGAALTVTATSSTPQLSVGSATNATQSASISGITFSYGDLLLTNSAEISSAYALSIGTNAAAGLGLYTDGIQRISIASGGAVSVAGNFACNGATPPAQSTGWGTPTGGGVISSFGGANATLANCSEVIAELILILKAAGILGA